MRNTYRSCFITVLLLFLFALEPLAQEKNVKYKISALSLPKSQNLFHSFFVSDQDKIFLPLNGGIYLPKDSLWFLPASKEYYFTSFAPDLKDTSCFVFANSSTATELYYLKSSKHSAIRKFCIAKLKRGSYAVIYKGSICYVWGHDGEQSKIGFLVNNKIKWLISIKGIIRQVQVDDKGEIFFALENSIHKLSTRQTIVTLASVISGFDFDKSGKIILSCADGIGIQKDKTIEIIATGLSGLIEYQNDVIYVLNSKGSSIFQIQQ